MVDAKIKLNDILESCKLSAGDIINLVDEDIIETIGEPNGNNDLFFAPNTLTRVQYIDDLMSLGYELKDATKIIQSFGTPDKFKLNSNGKKRNRKILFTPSELAKLFNVSPRAIKYWEEKLLIQPFKRSKSGIRFYHKKTKIEIMLLKAFQSLGFSLDKIKVFLDLYNFILLEENAIQKKDVKQINHFLFNLNSLDSKLLEFENSIESLKKLSGKGRKKLKIILKKNEVSEENK